MRLECEAPDSVEGRLTGQERERPGCTDSPGGENTDQVPGGQDR